MTDPIITRQQIDRTIERLKTEMTERKKAAVNMSTNILPAEKKPYLSTLEEAVQEAVEAKEEVNMISEREEKELTRLKNLPEPEFVITDFEHVTSRELVSLIGRRVVITGFNNGKNKCEEWIGIVQGAYKVEKEKNDGHLTIILDSLRSYSGGSGHDRINFNFNKNDQDLLEVY